MHVVGIFVALVGILFVFLRSKQSKRLYELRTVDERVIGDLLEVHGAVADELGTGAFEEQAAVRGVARADDVLTAPLSGQPCLYFEASVMLEMKRKVGGTGGTAPREEAAQRELMSERRGTRFAITDGAEAALPVDPEGARYDGLTETFDRFEPWAPGVSPQVGNYSAPTVAATAVEMPTGYRFRERLLPPSVDLTAIGTVSDRDGALELRDGPGGLVLSTHSRAELVISTRKQMKTLGILAGVFLALGATLIAVGLIG